MVKRLEGASYLRPEQQEQGLIAVDLGRFARRRITGHYQRVTFTDLPLPPIGQDGGQLHFKHTRSGGCGHPANMRSNRLIGHPGTVACSESASGLFRPVPTSRNIWGTRVGNRTDNSQHWFHNRSMGQAERPTCPHCREPLTLALPPGGKGPRTFQCFDCDRPDPLKTDALRWLMSPELKPPQ